MKREEPEKWSQTWRWMLPKDYVKFKFCGAVITDFSDASGTLLFEVPRLRWSEIIPSLFSIEREKMPEVAPSLTIVGKIQRDIATALGLRPDVVIVNGCADLIGESFVAFLLNPEHFLVRFGSAGSVSTVVERPEPDPDHRRTCYAHAMEGRWVIETSSQGFGLYERWFRERVLGKPLEEVFSLLNARLDSFQPSKLIFVPPIKGAPYWNPKQVGAFLGLSLDVGGLEMFQAVLEGICFSLKDAYEQLCKALNGTTYEHFFAGGGTRSRAWVKILASVLGVSARVVRAEPSIGAATLAARALGVDFGRGVIRSSLVGDCVECSKSLVDHYSKLYRLFSEVREKVTEFYPLLFGERN